MTAPLEAGHKLHLHEGDGGDLWPNVYNCKQGEGGVRAECLQLFTIAYNSGGSRQGGVVVEEEAI